MNEEVLKKLEEQDKKLEKIYISTEKTRKYILWALIFAVIVTVLPLIGMLFAIPAIFSLYGSYSSF